MKHLITILSLVFSMNLFAAPEDNLLSIIPYGKYEGLTAEGKKCFVHVLSSKFVEGVWVANGTGGINNKHYTADNFSVTKFNPYTDSFTQTKRIELGRRFMEDGLNIYKTADKRLVVEIWSVKFSKKVEDSDKLACILTKY